jgi:hypothetical protein
MLKPRAPRSGSIRACHAALPLPPAPSSTLVLAGTFGGGGRRRALVIGRRVPTTCFMTRRTWSPPELADPATQRILGHALFPQPIRGSQKSGHRTAYLPTSPGRDPGWNRYSRPSARRLPPWTME